MLDIIKEKQSELVECALLHGMNSETTIKCSQELDKLIIMYQKQSLLGVKETSA